MDAPADPLQPSGAPPPPAAAPPGPRAPARRGPLWKRRRRRSLAHRARRALRKALGRALLRLAVWAIPPIYLAYMWFVWKTSRVVDCGISLGHYVKFEEDGVVCVLWHEEVFSVAWAYREHTPHTLASLGDAGEVIARMLQLCGYVVLRGGSGAKSRRRGQVLSEMIEHMRKTPRVLYGITVDGSNGPPYKLKRGAIVIARECKKPLLVVRTWARRNIRLPTWDRMAVPLPFNVIHQYARGPFFVPEGADDPEVFEAFRRKIEDELNALRDRSLRDLGQPVPPPSAPASGRDPGPPGPAALPASGRSE